MTRMPRWRRRGLWACALVLLAAALSLLPYLADSAERVRLRNALLIDFGATDTRFDWTPASTPADFAVERAAPSAAFRERVAALRLQQYGSDWERAQAIGRHLLAARRQAPQGGPIQADLERTYREISARGDGYCGDYADVFTAMALAAGLQVRSWAFSFDGFGGHGHIFNEVWDAGSGRWHVIDVFNNLVPLDRNGQPMSALAMREALLRDDPDLPRLVPLEPLATPGFKYEDKARDYFRRGAAQWYLWWGNGVYSYDQAPLVRALGPLSRSLEQLGGIAQGVHPRIRVVLDDANRAHFEAMRRLRVHLLAVLAVSVAALAVAAALMLAGRRTATGQAVREQRHA